MKHFLLVDTDILIDVARENTQALNRLEEEEKKAILQISSITRMELIVGCRNKHELVSLDKFLERFVTINITEEISARAIELVYQYRLSHGLMIPDAIIAATVLILNCPLLSKNQKDYRFINDLNLLSYP